jgi:hypothetical protein
MAVIWSPAMLNSPGKKPTRGFGGRVYFYDGQNKAVPVEGQLVVYGYNDSKQHDSKTPDRKFAFTPEQFTSHFSRTELGASYSVWVPWDEVGNTQMDISLVPIFTASSGQLLVGQASKVVLPGPETPANQTQIERFALPPPEMIGSVPTSGVQQASFQQTATSNNQSAGALGLQETSIRLPSTLAERLAKAPPQQERLGLPRPPIDLGGGNFQQVSSATGNITGSSPGPLVASQQTFLANRPPPTRFSPPARPAPSSPTLQPTRGLPPSPPYPAARPYGPPSPPPAHPQIASPAAW